MNARDVSGAALVALVALSCVVASCGGGSDAPYSPAPVVCDPLGQLSYKYTVHADQSVNLAQASPSPPATSHPQFSLTESIEGATDGPHLDATITNSDGYNTATYEVVTLGDVGYMNDGRGWIQQDQSKRPLPLRYHPLDLCKALAPDLDTTIVASAQAGDVNGIRSHEFRFNGLPAKFFARNPDFGFPSDAAANISTLDADVWIADEGNYPTKIALASGGAYPDGQQITTDIAFEVIDVGSQMVQAPSNATVFATPDPGSVPPPKFYDVLRQDNAALGKPILVDPSGRALYEYTGDSAVTVCTPSCPTTWVAYTTLIGLTSPGPGITGTLSLTPRAAGRNQIEYNGAPLYTYQPDATPGDAKGDGVDGFHVVTP